MYTQIEFYDKDVIKNILGVITLKPEKVVFLYDKELKDMDTFTSLLKCFKKHIPNIILEKYPVNILSLEDVYQKTRNVIKENKKCVIELTGGSELMVIAGYKAGSEESVEMIYTDITKGQILDITNKDNIRKTAKLSLEDFVDSKGVRFIGNSHKPPEERDYKSILNICKIIFENLKEWKETCSFIQTVMANTGPYDLNFKSKTTIWQKNGRQVSVNKDFLYSFSKNGFIRNLEFKRNYVSFDFSSKETKQYMISYGVWLELFVYINAKRIKSFDDVLLGAMIDWNAYDGIVVAGNEIDVMLSENSMPVFISCKLRDADTAALNELVIAKKRLGGWFSKCVLVTFGNDKVNKTGTYKRAVELGVEVLDKHDILSDNFHERLERAVSEHNLVDLKWKKV